MQIPKNYKKITSEIALNTTLNVYLSLNVQHLNTQFECTTLMSVF